MVHIVMRLRRELEDIVWKNIKWIVKPCIFQMKIELEMYSSKIYSKAIRIKQIVKFKEKIEDCKKD